MSVPGDIECIESALAATYYEQASDPVDLDVPSAPRSRCEATVGGAVSLVDGTRDVHLNWSNLTSRQTHQSGCSVPAALVLRRRSDEREDAISKMAVDGAMSEYA